MGVKLKEVRTCNICGRELGKYMDGMEFYSKDNFQEFCFNCGMDEVKKELASGASLWHGDNQIVKCK